MKIGIMGGTFDPIHIGHLILAQQAKEQYALDQVYVMPNGIPRYKSDRTITPAQHRVEMVRLAIEDNPDLILSTLEIERSGYTYTYETLEQLTTAHPQDSYYFIIGADSLFAIKHWKHPERIADNCILLCANRNRVPEEQIRQQIQYLQERFHMCIRLLSCPAIDISSEMLRGRAEAGSSIRYYVTDKVHDYIKTHGLYRPDI